MVSGMEFAGVAEEYRRNTLAGASERQMLQLGLHGVTLFLTRANQAAVGAELDKSPTEVVKWAAKADRLLVFLSRIADPDTEMGQKLVQCYTGLQALITRALLDHNIVTGNMLERTIFEARTLERAVVQSHPGDGA